MLMHPIRPELDGKDLSGSTDPTGKHLFVSFVDTVKKDGQGFVEYLWPKPGHDQPVAKVSYVKGYAPWGWVVGSGVYVDDVQALFLKRMVEALLIGSAFTLLLAVTIWLISRSIMRQLGDEPTTLNTLVHAVAKGDLAVRSQQQRVHDGSVLHGILQMQESMARIVGQVRHGADGVAMASAEIAQGNHDLSARTESQASALEQTAASMEELGATVRHNADNAAQANQMANNASRIADQGGQTVEQVVHIMQSIHADSTKIGDIIGVIDSIAFQTNILALNAAVEAARAGEQGRGFAVVASEVRALAGRSAEAARQIKQLIHDSVTHVDEGRVLVDQAGNTMQEVVAQVVQTMDGISTSSKKIADIISVIDGIAFQTNILALNAAVEAARAGEQGRGFAVVASEVRSLAGRSAEASKEIKRLITDSVDRVEQGSTLVNQAGQTMEEVVHSVRRVTDIMGEISAASSEQSAGVTQVSEAVTHMDQATQQNAALVEEMSAAATSLNQQAQDLVQAVSVFRLEAGSAYRPVARSATAPAPRPAPSAPKVPATAPAAARLTARSPAPAKAPAAHAPASTPAMPPPPPAKHNDDDWEAF